jgi:hypothetical protein
VTKSASAYSTRKSARREITHELLAQMMGDVPDLIAAGELEVRGIGELGRANFAIMHRGGVLRDGFLTQPLAWMYVQRQLIAPSEIISEHENLGDQFVIHGNAGPKSWSIH